MSEKPFHVTRLYMKNEVKHSVVYANTQIPGFYIPKRLLPTPYPTFIELTFAIANVDPPTRTPEV